MNVLQITKTKKSGGCSLTAGRQAGSAWAHRLNLQPFRVLFIGSGYFLCLRYLTASSKAGSLFSI